MKFYVAGPMRGYDQFNFPAFDAASEKLRSYGHETVNPADLDRAAGYDVERLAALTPEEMAQFAREAIARDVDAILWGGVEAICRLPGWEKSRGSAVEIALGEFLCLPIYDYETMFSLAEVA